MAAIILEKNVITALHLADRAIILDTERGVLDGAALDALDNAGLRDEYPAI